MQRKLFGKDEDYDADPSRLHEAALMAKITGRRFGDKGEPALKTLKVYRVEMADGRGPFNTHRPDRPQIYKQLAQRPEPGWPGWLLTIPRFRQEQMGITEAMFYHTHGGAAYACCSLAGLNTWFPAPSRQYLAELGGAKIVEYSVPKGQPILHFPELADECIFNPKTAKRVRELPINMEITDAPLI